MSVKDLITSIKNKQRKIDRLLNTGKIKKIKPGVTEFNDGKIQIVETLYDKEANVALVEFPEEGTYFPDHDHGNSVEYVLMIEGKIGVEFEGSGYRVAKSKECVSIDSNQLHSVQILEANTKFLIVCIPKDDAISQLGE